MKRLIVFSLLIYFFTQKALFATVAMEDPEEINRVVRAILSNPTAVNWLTYEINNGICLDFTNPSYRQPIK